MSRPDRTGAFALTAGGLIVLSFLGGLPAESPVPLDGTVPAAHIENEVVHGYLVGPTPLDDSSILVDVENKANQSVKLVVRFVDPQIHAVDWQIATFAYDSNDWWNKQREGVMQRDREAIRITHEGETRSFGPDESQVNQVDPTWPAVVRSPPAQKELWIPPGMHHLLVGLVGFEANVSVQAEGDLRPDVVASRVVVDPGMFRFLNADIPGDWDEVTNEVYVSRVTRLIQEVRTVEEIRYNYSQVELYPPSAVGSYLELRLEDASGRWCSEEGMAVVGGAHNFLVASQLERGPFTVEGKVKNGQWWFPYHMMIVDLPLPEYSWYADKELCFPLHDSGGREGTDQEGNQDGHDFDVFGPIHEPAD